MNRAFCGACGPSRSVSGFKTVVSNGAWPISKCGMSTSTGASTLAASNVRACFESEEPKTVGNISGSAANKIARITNPIAWTSALVRYQ